MIHERITFTSDGSVYIKTYTIQKNPIFQGGEPGMSVCNNLSTYDERSKIGR